MNSPGAVRELVERGLRYPLKDYTASNLEALLRAIAELDERLAAVEKK